MISIGGKQELVLDCHGHLTTEDLAAAMQTYHWALLNADGDPRRLRSVPLPHISDEQIVESIRAKQVERMNQRGVDMTFFSPRASAMRPDLGSPEVSLLWSRASNDLIYRIVKLFPNHFIGVCQLPQSPGTSMEGSIEELERCVGQLGFVGCNMNPDSSGGKRAEPVLTDRYWHAFYAKAAELNVPIMVHVSGVCEEFNPQKHPEKGIHSTGEAYLHADISAFVNLIELSSKAGGSLFKGELANLKFIIPHGGGGVVQHWGRFEGMLQDNNRPPLKETMGENIFFDTCVYWRPGMEIMFRTLNPGNLLFGSETVGALRDKAIDPESGQHRDDTRYLIETLLVPSKEDAARNVPLKDEVKQMVFNGNHQRVYLRAASILTTRVIAL